MYKSVRSKCRLIDVNSQKAIGPAGASVHLGPTNKKVRMMNSISNISPICPDPTWRRCRLTHILAPLFLLALACFIFPLGLRAQSDDFNSGNDNGWTRYDPLAPFGGGATFSFPNGGHRIQVPGSPDVNGLGSARAAALHTDIIYSDFAAAVDVVDWDNSLTQAFGMLGRISNVGRGTATGYGFFYFAASHTAAINRIDNEVGGLNFD